MKPESGHMSEDKPKPTHTDHGAEILAGPFGEMLDAKKHQEEHGHLGIYWEAGKWYTHGASPGGDVETKLTTYN